MGQELKCPKISLALGNDQPIFYDIDQRIGLRMW